MQCARHVHDFRLSKYIRNKDYAANKDILSSVGHVSCLDQRCTHKCHILVAKVSKGEWDKVGSGEYSRRYVEV